MCDSQNEQQKACPTCGNDEHPRTGECPICGAQKCEGCDMGDDVPCLNCED